MQVSARIEPAGSRRRAFRRARSSAAPSSAVPSSAARSGRARSYAARRRRGVQAGFSLVEVLIAVALAGIVVLGISAGLLFLVRTTADTDARQQVALGLRNTTENLKASPYLPCGGPSSPTAAAYQTEFDGWDHGWTPPQGMTVEITDVGYWDPAARDFAAGCDSDDHDAQRLTVRVTWRGHDGTAQVVKRS